MQSLLTSVNQADPREVRTGAWTGSVGRTGIAKQPVTGPVRTGANQLTGHTICDRRHHGGPDKAVYAYAGEDAAWWAHRLHRPLPPGMFGENLTTAGVDVTNAVIGERWTIGTAQFEVSEPRIPCRVFAGYRDDPGWSSSSPALVGRARTCASSPPARCSPVTRFG